MIYRKGLELEAGTSEGAPISEVLSLTRGVISQIDLVLPPGCYGLVGVQLWRNQLQLYPLTRGEWFIGDDVHISIPTDFDLSERPFEIVVKGYNRDETYTHTPIIIIRMELEKERELKKLTETVEEGVGQFPIVTGELREAVKEELVKVYEELDGVILPELVAIEERIEELKETMRGRVTLSELSLI